MDKIIIQGGNNRLVGTVQIEGANDFNKCTRPFRRLHHEQCCSRFKYYCRLQSG